MTVIVSVLILAATVLLFSEKELASKWGVSILEEGGLVQRTAEEERAAERVEEFSRTYRLSPVSYTHLDVYKRQPLCPWRSSRAMPRSNPTC